MNNDTQKIKKTSLLLLAAATAWLSGCAAQMGTDEEAGQTQEALGGLILDKWVQLGGSNSYLGNPVAPTDEQTTYFNQGKYNNFQHGTILWKYGAPEAFAVFLNFYDTYSYLGWEWGMMGFPTKDQYVVGNRKAQKFEYGYLNYKNGFSWPAMSTNLGVSQAVSHSATQSFARLTAGSLPPALDGNTTCLVGVSGAGFTPNASVTFYLNSPTASVALGASVPANSSGSFSGYNQSKTSSSCFSLILVKINNVATIEARDGTHRAVFPISTSAGTNYIGTL